MRLFYQHVVRYALQHKLLAAVNVLSVALGAAVFLAVQVVNHSATRAFEAGIDVVAGRAHLEARGAIPVQLWPRLRHAPGCTAATPLVEGMLALPDYDREYLHLLGVDPLTNGPFQTFKLQRAPDRQFDADRWFGDPTAVAISREFADRHRLRLGDPLRVRTGEREVSLRVAFYLETGDADSHFAVMDIGWAQELLGRADQLTAVLFRLRTPQHPENVIAALHALLPKDVVIRSPEDRGAQVAYLLAGFQLNLTALSLVSLLVGVFLIYNTITASAVRRRAEIGILRSVGGSRSLVRYLFLGEAALYGGVGSVLGCFLGVLLARALVRTVAQTISNLYVLTSIEHLYFPVWEIPLVLTLGIGSALAGAWVPAQTAAGLPPLKALNLQFLADDQPRPRRGVWLAASALLFSLGLLSSWLAFAYNHLAGFGAAFFTLAGFCALSPLITYATGVRLSRWLRSSHVWRLAAQNLVRSVQHHAVTVAALASAVAMVVSVSVMIFSFRITVNRWIQRRLVADIFVTPVQNEITGFQSNVAPDFLERLRRLPEVQSIDAYRDETVTAAGQRVSLGAVIGSARSVPEFLGGRDREKFADFLGRDTVIISEPLARRLHLREGDRLRIISPEGERPFRVAGVYYDYTKDAGVILMQRENFLRYWHREGVHSVALYLRPGAVPQAVIDRIRQGDVSARFYALRSNAGLRQLVNKIFEQTFAVTYGLRLVAVLVALIGIVLNLTVLVKERDRELAVIRSLGALRRQVLGIVLAEAALLGSVAVMLGLVTGCTLAVVLTEVINKAFFGWTIPLQLPWDQLALVPVLLVPASVLGGLWPAWRAANAPIIAAIRE